MMTLAAVVLAVSLQEASAPPAVTAAPALAQSHIGQGIVLYKKRHFRAARDEFRKAVDADPSSAAANYYLGYALYKIGEPSRRLTPEKEESRGFFARAFELDPLFRPTWTP
jgi:tetratricopeptide (TPR) repeat protein